jgi:hypothetical protein
MHPYGTHVLCKREREKEKMSFLKYNCGFSDFLLHDNVGKPGCQKKTDNTGTWFFFFFFFFFFSAAAE